MIEKLKQNGFQFWAGIILPRDATFSFSRSFSPERSKEKED